MIDILFENIKRAFFALILVIASTPAALSQNNIIELEFARLLKSDTGISAAPWKILAVQSAGGTCQNGLYLITHSGDRTDLFQKENQKAIENPLINQSWRYCSVFSTLANDTVLMGRNWDNENVGSIIVNYYQPPGQYSSISFSRAIDLGFPLHMDLDEMPPDDLADRLLLSPFYSYDGINERGLAVAVAGSKNEKVGTVTGKELIFVPFLIRRILDQTKSIEEAMILAEKYVPFDIDANSLNSHLLIGDASGRSAILEYREDKWRIILSDKSWQVLSTKPVYNVPEATLRDGCWRYKGMSEALESMSGVIDIKQGLKILQDVSQVGTAWSVVYSLTTKELFFSVYQDWKKAYHLRFPF